MGRPARTTHARVVPYGMGKDVFLTFCLRPPPPLHDGPISCTKTGCRHDRSMKEEHAWNMHAWGVTADSFVIIMSAEKKITSVIASSRKRCRASVLHVTFTGTAWPLKLLSVVCRHIVAQRTTWAVFFIIYLDFLVTGMVLPSDELEFLVRACSICVCVLHPDRFWESVQHSDDLRIYCVINQL